ncbi:LIC12162 family protein [Geomonas oryzisoli]|uniref:LIC12162 family protein n=1 Tax=Geomonas oryzisoli TaxID=2847992 RepID=A0ABX8J303_9BACT|nr:LIC12162 family protein [Geomonas oryzisoli]QWV92768.1 LIC12162 family protein [Geomonas oryzisoli]
MTIASTTEPFFLATTAQEAFWDTEKRIVFLGEWCRLFSRKEYWQTLDATVAQSPYQTLAAVEHYYACASEICEELLTALTEALNEIHGTSHSLRFWRIVIGPWLFYYVHTNLDRFVRIKDVFAQHPDLTTVALSEQSFVVPRDTMEAVDLCKTDLFNLQLYSRVFTFLGHDFPTVEAPELPQAAKQTSKEKLTTRLFLLKAANFAVKKACTAIKDRPGILYKSSYFSPDVELQLFLRTRGKFRPVGRKPVRGAVGPTDSTLRGRLASYLPAGDDFRAFLQQVVPLDLPRCFLEGFRELADEASQYPLNPTAVFSSNAYFYDEAFKVWAGASAEKGALLLGSQHGGNYGVAKCLKPQEHEAAICDRYYSWGWHDDGHPVVTPFPAAKLTGRRTIGADNSKKRILLASTASFRYLVQFPFLPEYFDDYLAWQQLFCATLDEGRRKDLSVRLLAEDLGWDLKHRWRAAFPEVYLEEEGASANFSDSLAACRLFIADHVSTTYIEALSANKPTVMFFNRERYSVRGEAQRNLDLLRKAGILHDTPQQAAQVVNEVYADVEIWWNQPERQRARQEFCNVFGRTSHDSVSLWSREFLSIFNAGLKAR